MKLFELPDGMLINPDNVTTCSIGKCMGTHIVKYVFTNNQGVELTFDGKESAQAHKGEFKRHCNGTLMADMAREF